MTCRELVDFLMDYEEGTLGAEKRAVFERHLDACPGCLNYLETYRETVRIDAGCGHNRARRGST